MAGQRPPVTTCRSCSEPVIWCTTVFSNRMPVDVEPTETGNIVLSDHRPVPVANVVSPTGREPGQKLYTSHLATCPKAARHRRSDAAPAARRPVDQEALFGGRQ